MSKILSAKMWLFLVMAGMLLGMSGCRVPDWAREHGEAVAVAILEHYSEERELIAEAIVDGVRDFNDHLDTLARTEVELGKEIPDYALFIRNSLRDHGFETEEINDIIDKIFPPDDEVVTAAADRPDSIEPYLQVITEELRKE